MSASPSSPSSPADPSAAGSGSDLPFRVASTDQQTLLSVIKLKIATGCRAQAYASDCLVVKHEATREYLIVTPPQWKVLQRFGDGRTVPEVVFDLIASRECIPLNEFYELVVKAGQRGFLLDERGAAPAAVTPVEWTGKVRGSIARAAALSGMGALLGALIWRPLPQAATVVDAVIAWVVLGLALSAGNYLGACVVRHEGAEVYAAGWRWRTWLPRFHADLWDAIMGGRQAVVDSQVARLAPLFWMMAGLVFVAPGAVMIEFLGALFLLGPLWRGPGWALLHFLYRAPTLDALQHFEFEPNRELRRVLRTLWKNADWRFLGYRAAHTGVWLGLVLVATLLPLQGSLAEAWEHYRAFGGPRVTALTVAAGLGLLAVATIGLLGYVGCLNLRDWWREQFPSARVARVRAGGVDVAAIEALLRQCLLFRAFSDDERAAVARAVEVVAVGKRQIVVREGEPGDRLFIVYAGEAAVQRRTPTGRPETIARLGAGHVFGEVAILNHTTRTRTVSMPQGGTLLALTRTAFEQLVLSRLSRREIEAAVQKAGFLYRIPLAQDWSPAAITAFSAYSTMREFEAGDYILRRGQENRHFFVLYEGDLAVVKDREEVARLGIGDFFGEISLLQNSLTRASIKSVTPSRCLCIERDDFLKFVTKDFLVGLYFEDVSSRRLGRPIFPLNGPSFEAPHR